MKKLMIVCAAIAMAGAANAASASWQWRLGMATVAYTDAKGTLAAGNGIWFLNNADNGAAAILTQLRTYNGAVDSMKDYLDSVDIDSSTLDENGQMRTYKPSSTKQNSYTELGTLGEGGAANFYAVILGANGKSVFISDMTPVSVKTGDNLNTTINFTSVADDSKSNIFGDINTAYTSGAGHWYATASAVPEPTSGLLLLLGVAGLALRRRRA